MKTIIIDLMNKSELRFIECVRDYYIYKCTLYIIDNDNFKYSISLTQIKNARFY